MKDIDNTNGQLLLQTNETLDLVHLNNSQITKLKTRQINISGNVITTKQIDLDSPEWNIDNDLDEQHQVEYNLNEMTQKVQNGSVIIQQPLSKEQVLQKDTGNYAKTNRHRKDMDNDIIRLKLRRHYSSFVNNLPMQIYSMVKKETVQTCYKFKPIKQLTV